MIRSACPRIRVTPQGESANNVGGNVMKSEHSKSPRLSRREAIGLLGAGAGVGLVSGWRADAGLATAWAQAPGNQATFPPGAIIRTILKDISPQTITGA